MRGAGCDGPGGLDQSRRGRDTKGATGVAKFGGDRCSRYTTRRLILHPRERDRTSVVRDLPPRNLWPSRAKIIARKRCTSRKGTSLAANARH